MYHLLELQYGCYINVNGFYDDFDNVSTTEEILTDDFNVYLVVAFIVFAILNIGANSILIFGLFKTNKKMNCGQKLFFYLSCTDLMAGCVVMPILIYYQFFGLTCLYMALMMGIFAYIVFADACILFIVSVLRLSTIRNPLISRNNQKKRIWIMVILQIFFSISLSFGFFSVYFYGRYLRYFQTIGYISNAAHTGISLAVLACVSMSLYTIRKYKRSNSGIFTPEQLRNHRKTASSLLLIGLMMILFVAIQVPIFIMVHLQLSSKKEFQKTKQIVDVVILISQLNTLTNSVVIIGRSKKLKKYLFKICY